MPDEFIDLEYDRQAVEADRGVLELAVRHMRAFARYVTGNRGEADALVEDSLLLYLAEDRVLSQAGSCFTDLLGVFRRVRARLPMAYAGSQPPEPDFAALMTLPLEAREAAALVFGAGLPVARAARLLQISGEEAESLIDVVRCRIGAEGVPSWPFLAGALADTLPPDEDPPG